MSSGHLPECEQGASSNGSGPPDTFTAGTPRGARSVSVLWSSMVEWSTAGPHDLSTSCEVPTLDHAATAHAASASASLCETSPEGSSHTPMVTMAPSRSSATRWFYGESRREGVACCIL